MRVVLLRFVHCRRWRDELIVHSSLGCNTILFATAMYLKLSGPDHLRSVNKPPFIITVLLYLSCSTHFILGFIHFYTTLVCALSYTSHTFSKSHSRILPVLKDSQTSKTPSFRPVTSSQSRNAWANLFLSTAVGCCGPRATGSPFFRLLLRFRASVSNS